MDDVIIINESSNGRRYKCPYCDERHNKEELISHILDEHDEMIPEGYTPARLVFNVINKKDHGSCIICRKETKWDEDKCRYNRLCDNPACKKEYTRRAHMNTNIEEKMKDPEFQAKMLAGRSISGKYKFQDGGLVDYVGSYEKKFLEFMDKVLHVQSVDIQSPGPSIYYTYNGEEHFWITDFLYKPFNLVFDIKDGGSNPNTREMPEYREKQKAKEAAIKKQGRFNYIRLTDNNFEQLISIMLDLKMQLNEPNQKPIIRINETCAAIMTAMPNRTDNDVYIVNYQQNMVFARPEKEYHQAVCKGDMVEMFSVVDGQLTKIPFEEAAETWENIHMYRYTGKNRIDYNELLFLAQEETDFYSLLTDKPCCSTLDVMKDPEFVEEVSLIEQLKTIDSILKSTILNEAKKTYKGIEIKPVELVDETEKLGVDGVGVYRDIYGVFLADKNIKLRTASYESVDTIPKSDKKIILG